MGRIRAATSTPASFNRLHHLLHLLQSRRLQRPLSRGESRRSPPTTSLSGFGKKKERRPFAPASEIRGKCMLRHAKNGTHVTCQLRRRQHHGHFPHTPMGPMLGGGQDTMNGIDNLNMVIWGIHYGKALPPSRFLKELARPTQMSCLRCLRHQGPPR